MFNIVRGLNLIRIFIFLQNIISMIMRTLQIMFDKSIRAYAMFYYLVKLLLTMNIMKFFNMLLSVNENMSN